MHRFVVDPSDRGMWNRHELEKFLIDHQRSDIYITVKDEGCDCQQVGLYDLLDMFEFASVTIETANAVEQHHRYKIIVHASWIKFFLCIDDPVKYTPFHKWDLHRIFSIFYNLKLLKK